MNGTLGILVLLFLTVLSTTFSASDLFYPVPIIPHSHSAAQMLPSVGHGDVITWSCDNINFKIVSFSASLSLFFYVYVWDVHFLSVTSKWSNDFYASTCQLNPLNCIAHYATVYKRAY